MRKVFASLAGICQYFFKSVMKTDKTLAGWRDKIKIVASAEDIFRFGEGGNMTQQPGNFDEELRLGFEGLVENTIKEIKDLPVDGLRSDCGFQNIWEEFAYQVQIEESSSFRTYEQTIEWVCQGVVEELPDELVKSFWLSSDARDRCEHESSRRKIPAEVFLQWTN